MSTIHNQLAYAAELQLGIALAAGLGREEDGVSRLGETLGPTIDPWSQPEWAFLRGERLGAGRSFAAAVAAEFGIIAIGNALGSNSVVVVEAISVNMNAGTIVQLEVAADTAVAATLSAAAFMISARDRRFGSTTGRVFVKTGTDAGSTFGAQIEHQTNAVNQFADFKNLPIILKPGDDVLVIGQTVNLAMDVNFKWRERKAFPGELPA